MNRKIFKTMIGLGAIVSLLASCEPLEPSTYTEKFNRIGTVETKGSEAVFSIDYTGENLKFSNFNTIEDFSRYNVKEGDRVIANMTLNAIGNTAQFYVNSMTQVNVSNIESAAPSDTLNHYFRFGTWSLDGRFSYPQIWSNRHFINVVPITNPLSSEKDKVKYYIYPTDFMSDTLVMRISANVPGNNRMTNYEYSSLLCWDMSTLRDKVSESSEQEWRDSILNHFDNQELDSIYVQVTTHDSIWYHFNDTITWIKKGVLTTRIPYDF